MTTTIDTHPGDLEGQVITIRGTARNAASGAAVLLSDGSVVYIAGLSSWDKALDRKLVRATGTLRRKKLAPDPEVNEQGEVSHGMYGSSLVLEEATWEPAA